MATLAVRTELAEMAIIPTVTPRAPARHRNRAGRGPVAAVAVDLLVSTVQPETRFHAVIEVPQIPSVRVVAALA